MTSVRSSPVKIGAFVMIGLGLLVVAVFLIGSGRFFRRTHAFVSYFDGSVNGLRAGAAVKFKGVEVGHVDRVRIPYGLERTDQPIAVYYSLDGSQLAEDGELADDWADTLRAAIGNGLRAQLEADSLVTGVQHVSLMFMKDTEARFHDPIEGVMEIPTIPPPLQEIGTAIRSVVDRIGRYDFEALLDSLKSALDAVADLGRAPEIRSTFTSLDATLKEVRTMVARLNEHVDPLGARLEALAQRADAVGVDAQAGIADARSTLASVKGLADTISVSVRPLAVSLEETSSALLAMTEQLEATLSRTRILLDPEAPIAVELRAGLRELAETARATRALFELLERNPSALLRGRGEKEDQP